MQTGVWSLRKGLAHRTLRVLRLACLLLCVLGHEAVAEYCKICQKEIRYEIVTHEDKVTHTKYSMCTNCVKLPDQCYLCGMPVLKDFKTLPDARVICNRDLKSVVIDDEEALQICKKVKESLDSQFVRFMTFPDTNVTIQLMDRVKLQEVYRVIGNDFSCPDTRGLTETRTNRGQRQFDISILSGSVREELMTVCVHEYAHTWVIENVPADRQEKLKDAKEGFCELLAYLYAEQNGLASAKSNILRNYYTRGQIHLFIAAEQRYGLNDIIDWMKAGEDVLLKADDLGRVRRLEDPLRPAPALAANSTKLTDAPVESLVSAPPGPPKPQREAVLQGIMWSKNPTAIINGKTFSAAQQAELRLDGTNLLIRCLEIRTNSVLIRIEVSGEKRELALPLSSRQSFGTQPLPGI